MKFVPIFLKFSWISGKFIHFLITQILQCFKKVFLKFTFSNWLFWLKNGNFDLFIPLATNAYGDQRAISKHLRMQKKLFLSQAKIYLNLDLIKMSFLLWFLKCSLSNRKYRKIVGGVGLICKQFVLFNGSWQYINSGVCQCQSLTYKKHSQLFFTPSKIHYKCLHYQKQWRKWAQMLSYRYLIISVSNGEFARSKSLIQSKMLSKWP